MNTSHASASLSSHARPDRAQRAAQPGLELPSGHDTSVADAAVTEVLLGNRQTPLRGAMLKLLRQRLVRHARFAVRDHALAEDLVQETLLAVVERLDQHRGEATLTTWAMAILKHKVADWYRSPMRARTFQLDAQEAERASDPSNGADDALPGVAHSSQGPVDLAESRELMHALRLCVGAMPPRTAQAFLMHDWNGNLTAEICDQLQLSVGNVRQMLSRARKVLRDCMAHDWTDCKGRRALREKASTSRSTSDDRRNRT